MKFLKENPTTQNLCLLFITALIIRAAVFGLYVQHPDPVNGHARYYQPDTPGYHVSAVTMAHGIGMARLDNRQPTFWRTPGYPLYLSWFYKWYGLKSAGFKQNGPAQVASIWLQIIFDSLIPIIIFFLAFMLTGILWISWLAAWISVFHVGLVLASTFLLTEAISIPFFYLFLYFFYQSFSVWFENRKVTNWQRNLILAALCLGIFAWIRPMGEFIAVLSILLLAGLAHDKWKLKLSKIGLFALVFWASIAPWYIRNYQLTGKAVFCPMFGLYLNSFTAPKLVRRATGKPLTECHKMCHQMAAQEIRKEMIANHTNGTMIIQEIVHGKISWPIVFKYPWYAFIDWMKEVFKTTFDLYSSQHLVAFAKHTFHWDPMEEFLTEKTAEALYRQPMPLSMRIISWLELLFALIKWVGLFAGAWLFLIHPLFVRFSTSDFVKKMGFVWLKTAPLIGAACFMTGGFGYARLRLPIEPLMIILMLTFWYYTMYKKSND